MNKQTHPWLWRPNWSRGRTNIPKPRGDPHKVWWMNKDLGYRRDRAQQETSIQTTFWAAATIEVANTFWVFTKFVTPEPAGFL